MPPLILVVSPCEKTRQSICDKLLLLQHSYLCAEVLDHISAFKPCPALCILDQKALANIHIEQWSSWQQDCLAIRTAWLLVTDPQAAQQVFETDLEALSDTLLNLQDKGLLSSKIQTLLMLRKLSCQIDKTCLQLAHHKEELQDALRAAAHIQSSLIPTRQPRLSNLIFSWEYQPCKQVGGDLFNIAQLDEQTVMVYLVDVSGHGISSAMVTVSVHQSLSLHTGQLVKKPTDQPPFYSITPPSQVLQSLETEYPFERFEEFFTITFLLINPHTGQLRYCNGGHPPPLLVRSDGTVERLDSGGTIIGVGKQVAFQEGRTTMKKGDRLFMYTDGITEHLGITGETYGEDRFLEELLEQRMTPLDVANSNVLSAMLKFGGNTQPIDDITLISMEFR